MINLKTNICFVTYILQNCLKKSIISYTYNYYKTTMNNITVKDKNLNWQYQQLIETTKITVSTFSAPKIFIGGIYALN